MNIADLRPFQLLYVSHAAPHATDDVVADIATVSSRRNLGCGISGALLFDGSRFCQLLEGAEFEVRSLMTRIGVDPRHFDLSITAARHFGLPRLTAHWRMGYCDPNVLDPFTTEPPPRDEVALALFMSALARSAVD